MEGHLLLILILSFLHYDANATETISAKEQERTFSIGEHTFLMNDKPFRYISGTLHYFRVHPSSWRDRLRKMKYAGLNAVQTYSIWSSHEPEIGKYKFDDILDIVAFIKMAQDEGLYVILRPGPYIDAEVDMGGLPYWLLRENPNIKLRTFDPSYIRYVESWLKVILKKIKPLLFQNGGPIIMVQIENEYGSFSACDFKYTSFLRDLTKSILGDQVVLFTTDGHSTKALKCGKIPGVYATVDFGIGVNIKEAFTIQRLFEPVGPLVNSEFYTGWLDHWGYPHSTRSAWVFAYYLDELLAMGASVNLYVFNGGTSFGMLSGSNIIDDKFMACPTSYDYDAPLNEAGDPTTKYFLIRNITAKYTKLPSGVVPPASPKYSYGKVLMKQLGGFSHTEKRFNSIPTYSDPLTFEELSVANGVVAYQTIIKHTTSDPSLLAFSNVKDRGYIFLDETYVGVVSRDQKIFSLGIHAKPGQLLTIVVESMGRVSFGEEIRDWKGIKKVTLSGIKLSDWIMIPFNFDDSKQMDELLSNVNTATIKPYHPMSIFDGEFEITLTSPQDTFLKQDIWYKGYVWINGFLLGRYWPVVGPQMTMYVPAGILRHGKNSIRIFEMEQITTNKDDGFYVEFVNTSVINGPTPFYT